MSGEHDTRVLPRASPIGPDGRRRVLDGALFGLYEDDEEPPAPVPKVLVALVVVAALVVTGLAWRAVNTDAELAVPAGSTSSTDPAASAAERPTVDDLRLLLPPELECVEPDDQPTDDPPRVLLRCPGDGVPETTNVFLYGTAVDRDEAFDYVTTVLQIPDGDETSECALGQPSVHDYIGVREVGRVGCQSVDGRVDFVWTTDRAPLLLAATGGGSFGDHYRSWATVVDRTDDAFPLGPEQVLLDQLPDALLEDCARDVDLSLEAGGGAAVTCQTQAFVPEAVSWVQFRSGEAMESWIVGRRDALVDPARSERDDACTPGGFGRAADAGIDDAEDQAGTPVPGRRPDTGYEPYELDGSSGTVLCHVDDAGLSTVTWARDGSLIGSVAVSRVSMGELLAWWRSGGVRP